MSDRPVYIEVQHATKAFGEGAKRNIVLRDFSLDIRKGEFLTFFGPNGCGKTTLLNVIVGVECLDEGSIHINSGSSHPRVGYVFQDYRGYLMPWLTVAENIAFPLRIRGVPKAERMRQVEAVVARFHFRIDLSAYTYALSGGQAQLTSILRALILDPDILIMDEPFSALDYQTNLSLYEKVLQIWEATGVTILLVSHDIDEALYLGERTVFLTKRPASVAAVVESKLPAQKELTQMGSEDFASMKKQALEIFRREALEKSA